MKKVVIIDPAETFAKYLGRVVTRLGCEILHAGDGEAGLALVESSRPDLVITEYAVPPHGGLVVCRELVGSSRVGGLPVVFVATDGSASSMKKARQAGCADYLVKPVTVREIHHMLQRNLPVDERRRAVRVRVAVDVVILAGNRRIEARTETFSEGGLLVKLCDPLLNQGLLVGLLILLPGSSEPIILTGLVAYVVQGIDPRQLPGFGITFMHVGHSASARLKRFIEKAIS